MTVATSTAFSTLQYHYANRFAALEGDRPVVGRIGTSVPIEPILASGRLPLLVAAEMGSPTPTAEIYMEPVIPPETKSLFEIAVSGRLQQLDLLVLSRPYAHLYYYLKEVHRLGRAPLLPPIHMYDLMQSQREAVRAYNWSQTQALLTRLSDSRPVADAALRSATAQTNRVRALQRQLLERRWTAHLSGVDALQAIGAGYFMPLQDYAETLELYLRDLQPDPRLAGRRRLLVLPSEPLSHLHLHQTLEDAGALVVAEDDAWGSRAPGGDVPPTGSALEGIFLKYWLDSQSSNVTPAEPREAWFTHHVERPGVDGVVFYLPTSDHQLGWDYPRLKTLVDQMRKPSILIREDAALPTGRDAIARKLLEWLA